MQGEQNGHHRHIGQTKADSQNPEQTSQETWQSWTCHKGVEIMAVTELRWHDLNEEGKQKVLDHLDAESEEEINTDNYIVAVLE